MEDAIGKRLKTLREMHGVSERKLSEISGIKRSRLKQIEVGKREISFFELATLSQIYGKELVTWAIDAPLTKKNTIIS